MPRRFNFRNLQTPVRNQMLAEVKQDISDDVLYLSKNFTPDGMLTYPSALLAAVRLHDESWLAEQLDGAFLTQDSAGKSVRHDMNCFFAGSEFNRFYVRGVCLVAIKHSHANVEVYRARKSSQTRAESQAIIGTLYNPTDILHDLRKRVGTTPKLGLPLINSGLSVCLPKAK